MSHSDEFPNPYNWTPELTKAMNDLAQVNTALVMIGRIERELPEMMTPELAEMRVTLNELVQRMMPHINDLIRREEYLKRGL